MQGNKNEEKRFFDEIKLRLFSLEAQSLNDNEKKNREINKIKIDLTKKYNIKRIVRNNEILIHTTDEIERTKLAKILNIKKIRSVSGVTVVALFAKPHRCPHGKCIFCPGGPNSSFGDTPQSYTGSEPAAMRAIRNDYEPYLQIFNRLEHYVINGIIPDKLELIIMGGTFPSLPSEYKDSFIQQTYKAINDFGNLFIRYNHLGKKSVNFVKFKRFFEIAEKDEIIREKILKQRVKKYRDKVILNIHLEFELNKDLCPNFEKILKIIDILSERIKKGDKVTISFNSSKDFYTFLEIRKKEIIEFLDTVENIGLKKDETLDVGDERTSYSFQKDLFLKLKNKIVFLKESIVINSFFGADIYIKMNIHKFNIQIRDNFSKQNHNVERHKNKCQNNKVFNSQKTEIREIDFLNLEINKLENKLKEKIYQIEILRAEKALVRPIGLTIETRPDWTKKTDLIKILEYGATRIEIGVQTLNETILKKTKRGHSLKDTIQAFQNAKDLAFKINAHIMLNLPFTRDKDDIETIRLLFEDSKYRPDMIKIYPCLITKGTELYELWKNKKFEPINKENLIKLIVKMYHYIPRWTRVMRIQRDIPTKNIIAGIKNLNIREDVEKRLNEVYERVDEMRFREVGFKKQKKEQIGTPKLNITKYKASKGIEYFIEYTDQYNTLFGFCRLRFPDQVDLVDEISNETALIRELHIYGKTEIVENNKQSKFLEREKSFSKIDYNLNRIQHSGLGKRLIEKAEEIAIENKYKRIAIISGIGVREYYQKLGYHKEKFYMVKNISEN